ncbi:ABC transporter substrate-binding protein [Brachyspira hyodysenteriae]|nr:ABC transporter substrate-binding protein [Brachyspira hyodysenteriae]MDA1467637.1 ABC transporter substrate-binding protein [Brachyspira hyodysenteriae]
MKTVRIFLFIFFSIFLFSCRDADKSNNNLSIKDRAGNDIILPEKIENIASLTPSATDIILSLGISDKIIAFDSTSKEILYTNNIDVSNIPVFDMLNPDSEKIIAMKPDIVFVNNLSVFSLKNFVRFYKSFRRICVGVILKRDTIKSIEDDITFLSNVLNKSDAASNIINIMNKNIENIRTIGESIQNKKKVYFEIAALPNLYSFGTNVYIDDMINIIGASNVFSDKNSWISTSEENILLFSNPDIIFTSADYIDNPTEEILKRKSWSNINAVKNKDVYYIASSSLPTHNIVNAMIMMAKYTYPNEYKDIEIIRN